MCGVGVCVVLVFCLVPIWFMFVGDAFEGTVPESV